MEPQFEQFNVFYKLEMKDIGWISFVERSKVVTVVVAKSSPESLRDWKRFFFYLKKEAIPVVMQWLNIRSGQKVPLFEVVKDIQEEDWFKVLSAHQTRLDDLDRCDEGMLKLLGVSRLGIREGYDVIQYGNGGMESLAGKHLALSLFILSSFDMISIVSSLFCIFAGERLFEIFAQRVSCTFQKNQKFFHF